MSHDHSRDERAAQPQQHAAQQTPQADADILDAPLVAPGTPVPERPRPTLLAYEGATPEQIADEIAAQYDLTTPEGWTEAMRSLAARPEVLRTLVRWLTAPETTPALFKAALEYATENGIGRPVERHEHRHRHEHRVIAPPIGWTDEPPPAITATATLTTP